MSLIIWQFAKGNLFKKTLQDAIILYSKNIWGKKFNNIVFQVTSRGGAKEIRSDLDEIEGKHVDLSPDKVGRTVLNL